ncbi:uncharacterized [Tachysurus ichikawai]
MGARGARGILCQCRSQLLIKYDNVPHHALMSNNAWEGWRDSGILYTVCDEAPGRSAVTIRINHRAGAVCRPEKCLESFYSALDRVVEEPETVKAWPNLLRERFGAAFHHVLCGFLDLHVPAAAGIMGPHPLNFDIAVCVCRKLSSTLCQDRLTAVCERVCAPAEVEASQSQVSV